MQDTTIGRRDKTKLYQQEQDTTKGRRDETKLYKQQQDTTKGRRDEIKLYQQQQDTTKGRRDEIKLTEKSGELVERRTGDFVTGCGGLNTPIHRRERRELESKRKSIYQRTGTRHRKGKKRC